MTEELKDLPIRIAFRMEGNMWVARAVFNGRPEAEGLTIGSIVMRAIDENPFIKEMFIQLMTISLEQGLNSVSDGMIETMEWTRIYKGAH